MAFKIYLRRVYPDTVESGCTYVDIEYRDDVRVISMTKTYKLAYTNYSDVQSVKNMVKDERDRLNQMYSIRDMLVTFIDQEIT